MRYYTSLHHKKLQRERSSIGQKWFQFRTVLVTLQFWFPKFSIGHIFIKYLLICKCSFQFLIWRNLIRILSMQLDNKLNMTSVGAVHKRDKDILSILPAFSFMYDPFLFFSFSLHSIFSMVTSSKLLSIKYLCQIVTHLTLKELDQFFFVMSTHSHFCNLSSDIGLKQSFITGWF